MIKRVKITESQFQRVNKELSETPAQDISNMRHNVADLKQNELKVIARDYISKAFQLGCEYEKTSVLDMAQRKEIMRKLNELQAKIDTVK